MDFAFMNADLPRRIGRTMKGRWLSPFWKNRAGAALARWAESHLGGPFQAQRLGGNARLTLRLSSGHESYIAQHGKESDRFHTFVRLGGHLLAQGVRVPRILHCELRRRYVLLEDLGVASAASALAGKELSGEMLGRSIRQLAVFHARGTRSLEKHWRIPVFDIDKWMSHTMRGLAFALRKYCPQIPPARLAEAGAELRRYRAEVEPERGTWRLCHTDCHLGNFLLNDGELYMLDWEDAKLAPPAVDLAVFFMHCNLGIPGLWRYRDQGLALYLAESDLPVEEHASFMRQAEFFETGFLLRRMAQRLEKGGDKGGVLRERGDAVLRREPLASCSALGDIVRSAQAALHA